LPHQKNINKEKNEIYNVPYVLHDDGKFRRAHYCIILNFKIYTIEPLQIAEVFFYSEFSSEFYKEIK
jgi:hypothetical protein